MGLRIRTNISALTAMRALSQTTQEAGESMSKLSSGFRINKAADDAAGLAISENMKAKIRSLGQARRNASDAVSLVQVTESGMSEVSNILVRLRELAVQTATDTIGNTERGYANREYVQLVDEIDRISNSTEFNGVRMFLGGEGNNGLTELTFHVGNGDGSVPNTDTINLDIEQLRLNSGEILGLGKESEIGPISQDVPFDRTIAAQKLSVIDTAMQYIASSRSTLGAKQSRLTSTINNLGVQIENTAASNSRIRDVDFAAETATLTQTRILSQAGTSVLSQANQFPELALTLLR